MKLNPSKALILPPNDWIIMSDIPSLVISANDAGAINPLLESDCSKIALLAKELFKTSLILAM